MAASIPSKPVDSVNGPECGYNNVTGSETCSGTKQDGSTLKFATDPNARNVTQSRWKDAI
ncbi:hypothetical protein LAWI1_G003828 [Lachnellula willkommii]|uniref:Uncharacterized protein n=1 Tax=Lachnellula willkommii TaxID=215461 RepID=A0A559MCB8_9HELO|nr:hypothetical protein LAWI1_G003828 [Lachnellula willkommii]